MVKASVGVILRVGIGVVLMVGDGAVLKIVLEVDVEENSKAE